MVTLRYQNGVNRHQDSPTHRPSLSDVKLRRNILKIAEILTKTYGSLPSLWG